MSIQDRATLYLQFENGDVPTQSGFQNLIDSSLNLAETQSQAMSGHLSVPELSSPIVSAATGRITLIETATLSATNMTAGSGTITTLNAPTLNTTTASATNLTAANSLVTTLQRYTPATVSAAGTTQGTAAACSAVFNIVTGVVDGATTGVFLPYGQPGEIQYVINNTSVSANLWPQSGGTINNLASNAAFGMTANTGYTVMTVSSAKWMVK